MFRVAVDVGGTFTDAVMVDDASGRLYVLKIGSTPSLPEEGFASAVIGIISGRADPDRVGSIVHVGTIASNLLLGQVGIKIPRCALLSTKGFRDILEIGRQNRSELYNINFRRLRTLVPRNLRFEADERVTSNGRVSVRIGEEELRRLAKRMRSSGIETVAISFLNSYVNDSNERLAEKVLTKLLRVPIYASSDVDPEHREYERTSTTVVNAVLAPVVAKYVASASEKMREIGISSELHILASSGGLLDVAEVKRRPILAIESGPAAGVVAAAELARLLGLRRIISFDMGGTTAKAGTVFDFQPLSVPEIEVGGRVNRGRVVKSSGYPVRTPSVDLAEVSAGGGTIISVGEAGEIIVGPRSAGADPGPACYGKGGRAATVTDANLVLGRMGTTILGGGFHLDAGKAFEAFERLGGRSGMKPHKLAVASLKIINVQMAKAIEIVSLERGLDPRDFALVAFGGAGPMHAAELAERIEMKRVIVPPVPGLFSALGMLMTDMKYNTVRGLVGLLDDIGEDEVEDSYVKMEAEGEERLRERGLAARPSFTRSIDLRYYGQGYELEIEVSGRFDRKAVSGGFERKHAAVYGFVHEGEKIEVTALRSTMIVPVTKASLTKLHGEESTGTVKKWRRVRFRGEWFETLIYPRELVSLGKITGPAIFEGYDSTVVVPPGWVCGKNDLGCLILERKEA